MSEAAMVAWVSDGGLETDLVFHHGTDLPQFAAFPLVQDPGGARVLERYYRDYAAIAAAAPDWYGINCAHPTHVTPALDGGQWQSRIRVFRPNASTLTHAELDEMEVLDEGDRPLLRSATAALLADLPGIDTLDGCCGTDASHVAQLWGVPSP
ncbi:MAG: homocysteine S-methyltransferase family protein [Sporichthyaceae bacterium]